MMTVFVHCSNVLLDWVDRLRTMQQSVNFLHVHVYYCTACIIQLYKHRGKNLQIIFDSSLKLRGFIVCLFLVFFSCNRASPRNHLLRLESSFRTIIAHNVNSNYSSAQRCLKLGLLCKLKPLYRRHFEFTSTICIVSSANVFFSLECQANAIFKNVEVFFQNYKESSRDIPLRPNCLHWTIYQQNVPMLR